MGISNPGGGGFTDILKWYDPGPLAAPGRFDVSGIPPGYQTIKLILSNVRSDVAAAIDSIYMHFNGDTTAANYQYTLLGIEAGAATPSGGANAYMAVVPGATTTAEYISNFSIEIENYNTTKHKSSFSRGVIRRSDGGAETMIYLFSHAWENTATINRITIQPDGYSADEFIAGVRLQIWLYK